MAGEPEFNFKKIAIVGAGPVGAVLAAFLARGGHDVVLCDVRQELVEPAAGPGIIIEGEESFQQPVSGVCTSVDDLAAHDPDVIFLTVKANALPLIASAIEGFIRPGMFAVSWQNGLDTELALAEKLGRDAVIRAVVNYGCTLIEPGRVNLAFHHPPHIIQGLGKEAQTAALSIAGILTKCGLPTQESEDIVPIVWRKNIMNSCMNPVCAITGMTMSEAINDPIIFQLIDSVIKESVNVARANEIFLGWDYYPYCMDYIKNAGNHKPSMLVDIEQNRRTEIDFMNGKIVEYGQRVNLETPFNSTLRALVKALEPK